MRGRFIAFGTLFLASSFAQISGGQTPPPPPTPVTQPATVTKSDSSAKTEKPTKPDATANASSESAKQSLPPGATGVDSRGRFVFPKTLAGRRAEKRYNFQADQARARAEAAAWEAYAAKMGPIVAAQQREQWMRQYQLNQLQIEAAKANAMQRQASAIEKDAEINRQRLQLEAYELFQSQNR